ncbi:IS630 family transposase [Orientia tsutsugamushi]|nr:IS630 family transposase [Orientia tsutsugamushi]
MARSYSYDLRMKLFKALDDGLSIVKVCKIFNRLLLKLVKEFKIINARDQIKSKSESFMSISIFVSNNFELP